MIPLKQNLFLFFEENEQQHIIDRKLVLLYANRCIIDEDAQFEICGIYELERVTELMYERTNPSYKTNAAKRTLKESSDRYTISEAFEKASTKESSLVDSHFIIGSSFHSLQDQFPTVINRPRKLLEWISDDLKSHELRAVYLTLLAGNRMNILTKELNTIAYDGKMVIDYTTPFARDKKIPINSKCSVNDDFELSISLIRCGRRLEQNMQLFLHPMVTPNQLKLIERKDESYLRSFGNHLTGYGVGIKEKLKETPDSDPKVRFVSCYCIRRSFYFK